MSKCRMQLFALLTLMLAVGGLAIFAPSSTVSPAIAAEPMLASDAGTWKTLIKDKDLEGILDVQTEEIKKAMMSKATFQRGFRKMELIGHLVAALGNAGTMTKEGDDAKKAAALREAGLKLAAASKAKNYDDAKLAADTIAEYPAKIAPAADAAPAKFTDILPLEILMKGVSSIDSATGAAVRKDDKFKKDAKDLTYQSILMAILAVVARDHNENADWKGWCDDMRDLSMAMSGQFQKRDFEASKQARSNLQKSCTDCHDVYRKEE